MFFRVEGDKAADWKQVQKDKTTVLKYVRTTDSCDAGSTCFDSRGAYVSLMVDGWSDPVFTVRRPDYPKHKDGLALQFFFVRNEVTPTNMAVRLWKCM